MKKPIDPEGLKEKRWKWIPGVNRSYMKHLVDMSQSQVWYDESSA